MSVLLCQTNIRMCTKWRSQLLDSLLFVSPHNYVIGVDLSLKQMRAKFAKLANKFVNIAFNASLLCVLFGHTSPYTQSSSQLRDQYGRPLEQIS